MAKHNPSQRGLGEEDILNLPDAPDFISTPPLYTVNEMIEICEKMLPYWNKLRFAAPEEPLMSEEFILVE